ncbi:MAG: hypothetical protein IPM71_04370 [Bacteroidota bacterium]|nr:MAG: hypothetical protein IPM71_04370 [Bacteroidota bacterium]
MRTAIIILISLLNIVPLIAQNQPSDKVQAARVKFFNEKLELTPDESKKFWPIYNDYQSRKNKLTTERKNLMSFFSSNQSNMSEKEIAETLDRYVAIEKEETQLLETYNQKFRQVLPDEKVLKIYLTEIQFRNYLLKQLRTQQQEIKPRN